MLLQNVVSFYTYMRGLWGDLFITSFYRIQLLAEYIDLSLALALVLALALA